MIDGHQYQLLPDLTCDEYAALKDDIARRGVQVPIEYDEEGTVLDGHHRLRACAELGVKDWPRVVRVGMSEQEKQRHVLALNLNRRHLNESQRAMIAAKLATLPHGVRSDRVDRPIGLSTTQPEAAEMLGVGERSVKRARVVLEEAPPDVIEAVEQGRLSVSKAAKEVKRNAKVAAKITPLPDLPASSDRYQLFIADIREHELDPASVDFIVTDPPYSAEYMDLYEVLSEKAARWLKPGGSLLAMCGQSYLPEIIYRLEQHMIYQWTLSYLTPGGQSAQLWQRKVNTFWKPVLWFVNGNYTGDWIGDVAKSPINDKRFHDWSQSESGMADLINRFAYPGQTICDPFCGGGTTGVVAIKMDLFFIGIDNDPQCIEITKERLADV